jgi:hypothetical protein
MGKSVRLGEAVELQGISDAEDPDFGTDANKLRRCSNECAKTN